MCLARELVDEDTEVDDDGQRAEDLISDRPVRRG